MAELFVSSRSNETNEIVPPHCARDDGRRIVCDSAQTGVYNYIINDDFAAKGISRLLLRGCIPLCGRVVGRLLCVLAH